ncbi:14140_t:CDS:2, partial [Rhizophagus irregularis]
KFQANFATMTSVRPVLQRPVTTVGTVGGVVVYSGDVLASLTEDMTTMANSDGVSTLDRYSLD